MPETERDPETDASNKTHIQMTIGELRKTYGTDVAKGHADHERLADVLHKLPSLRRLIREYEARRFEQIFEL